LLHHSAEENINNCNYWNDRFSTDWTGKGGDVQTEEHILTLLPFLRLPRNYEGTIMDFGCAIGNGMPILRRYFPKARFIGVDYSRTAISQCIRRYGDLAEFVCNEDSEIPHADIIISLHVIEHITDDKAVIELLLKKCRSLYVTVPYQEDISLVPEHVHRYDIEYFKELKEYRNCYVIAERPFTLFGAVRSLYHIEAKNAIKWFLGRRLSKRRRQIVYVFENDTETT